MENIFDWSVILSLVGVLVAITNIIVQVLKKHHRGVVHGCRCGCAWLYGRLRRHVRL